MMGMSKRDDMEALERQVRPWLEKRGIPIENYRNLPLTYKVWLHDQVCTQTYPLSDRQSRDLYRKLCSLRGIAERDFVDPVDSKTDEQLRTFFSPLTPNQGMLLVDWGCE